ncbi:hypothetical protein NDU88_000182 [Pleurodeles waltl]|uniref:Uncharacterized protein n=1 Tax=Pleurodeles waltl TaxID=8319 RepID=A0AAV7S658_PLEWA|nr:hypothetical protein NDU88_000182 [Pleurodeles waltl]
MPGCHGDLSVVRWQLRGAGKREALILVTGINITTINYGFYCLYYNILATIHASARALEKRKLLTVLMPGCHGDQSVVRWQLRGAGKREALILVTGINITTINYGLVLPLLQHFASGRCSQDVIHETGLPGNLHL